MNIRLRNIGVIKDSTIKINGLTVITGQNNSGKTTVGKVLYSLVDAVDNIKAKSDNDRYEYAIKIYKKQMRCCQHTLCFEMIMKKLIIRH